MHQQKVCICCLTDRYGDTAIGQSSPLQSLGTYFQTLRYLNLTYGAGKKDGNPQTFTTAVLGLFSFFVRSLPMLLSHISTLNYAQARRK